MCNAMSLSMMKQLIVCLKLSQSIPECKVIIIAGEGGVFSSGHNLKEILTATNASNGAMIEEILNTCHSLMSFIHSSSIPTIAMIDGYASAAGLQLACACDLSIATETSKFQLPGVNIGLFCHTPAVEVLNCIGKKHAMQLLLTGEEMNATQALRIGLINYIVLNDKQLYDKTLQIALKIASKSKAVISLGKKCINEQMARKECLSDAYAIANKYMMFNILHVDDAKEGMQAFLQKRSPIWTKTTKQSKL